MPDLLTILAYLTSFLFTATVAAVVLTITALALAVLIYAGYALVRYGWRRD